MDGTTVGARQEVRGKRHGPEQKSSRVEIGKHCPCYVDGFAGPGKGELSHAGVCMGYHLDASMRGVGEVQVEAREGLSLGEDGVAGHPHLEAGPKGRGGEENAHVLRRVLMLPRMRVEHVASDPGHPEEAE